jgi:membrane associated rhomboid family serine protease
LIKLSSLYTWSKKSIYSIILNINKTIVSSMNQFLETLQNLVAAIQVNIFFLLKIILGLWLLNIINWLVGSRLNYFGIYPRSLRGLPGIILSPLLHGNFNHLFFNSIPLFVLGNLVLLNGQANFYCVSVMIIILSGFGVWLFGRLAIHIGASSIIMGYFGYLLTEAYYHNSVIAIILGFICLYYFGGLILMLLPGKKGVSWEGHVFGFIAGIIAAFFSPLALQIGAIIVR